MKPGRFSQWIVQRWPSSRPARASRWAPVQSAPSTAPDRSARRSQANSSRSAMCSAPSPVHRISVGRFGPAPIVDVGEALVGRHQAAVAGAHQTALLGDDLPVVERPPGHPVGDAERLDRRGERDHRELRQHHEREALRRPGRWPGRNRVARLCCPLARLIAPLLRGCAEFRCRKLDIRLPISTARAGKASSGADVVAGDTRCRGRRCAATPAPVTLHFQAGSGALP